MTRRSLTVAVVVLVVQNTLASCPDGAQCDIEYTYCSLANGSSSCCQHPSAICCPGGNTCCLEGQACALDSCYQHVLTWPFVGYKGNQKKAVPISICGNKDHSDDELQNVVGSPRVQGREKNEYSGGSGKEDPQVGSSELQIREEVECPDKSLCPLDFTCCPAKPSGYGCCPIENAVCCSDQVHCCPANTICSSDTHECLQVYMSVAGHNTSIRIEIFPSSSTIPSSFPATTSSPLHNSSPSLTYFGSSFLWLTFLPPALSSASTHTYASPILSFFMLIFIHLFNSSGGLQAVHAQEQLQLRPTASVVC
ncbi:uncharacterized protein LOC143038572 isoform X2 [Oratosquilla oratoria]|uniref:uncharacterized protein LOC143038572 isoform X2 n=1 Tax=Oratosquilla oratoria TaxID=337810 RepID=UPI003F76F5FD